MIRTYVFFLFVAIGFSVNGQTLRKFDFRLSNGIEISTLSLAQSETEIQAHPVPLFSMDVNGNNVSSVEASAQQEGDLIRFTFANGLIGTLNSISNGTKGWKGIIMLENPTEDTLNLENMVPFGATGEHVYITSSGPWSLARSKLYLPDKVPVSVILPDNAWELGYGAIKLDDNYSVCAIARRTQKDKAVAKRYKTFLPPSGRVTYTIYADLYQGPWQNGLEKMFHERYLYDLDEFDNTLFNRKDLKWIRDKYVISLQFAWDKDFYDPVTRKFRLYNYLKEGEKWFGGYDVYGIWPTWPRLGLDERNQWDLYSDLPYGLEKLKELSNYARANHTRFFIAYNPWDQSTKKTDPYQSMSELIGATQADGVVLDTRGNSGNLLQEAADRAKTGVIMYSEGMAVPKDMPGIVAGRVHNAIEISPILNLNKLIKPEFAIFRVVTLNRKGIHRDIAVSFFNGYGTEINVFNPERPQWMEREYSYLGLTTRILRENSTVFLNDKWRPLVSALKDQMWVNKWKDDHKILFTVFSLDPAGYTGPLIEMKPDTGFHYVSLWNHEEVTPEVIDGKSYLPVKIKEFNREKLGTNLEGNVECVAGLPRLLKVDLIGNLLHVTAPAGYKIRIWKGNPSYQNRFQSYEKEILSISLTDLFGRGAGKFVIQLIKNQQIADERIVYLEAGIPYLVSQKTTTKKHKLTPPNMVKVEGGTFVFQVSNPDQFIPYPDFSIPDTLHIETFYMDQFPVTNADFYEFLQETLYKPKDPTNFLKTWKNGIYPPGRDNYPVVYISLEDARAFAKWAGKRLPTEVEWQYAAQGNNGRIWPWGNDFHGTKCNNGFGRPTPVNAFPKGKSPFKVEDMVGNVWQLTNDVYEDDSYRFVIIRGGSYFNPTSSQWYIKGGAQPLNRTQMLLMVSPGFDRSSTVGFRCVSDAD